MTLEHNALGHGDLALTHLLYSTHDDAIASITIASQFYFNYPYNMHISLAVMRLFFTHQVKNGPQSPCTQAREGILRATEPPDGQRGAQGPP